MKRIPYSRCFFLGLILLACSFSLDASPQVKHFFPLRDQLLGEPSFWIVELRYPLWETYRLQAQRLDGVEVTIPDPALIREGSEIVARYRIRIIPTRLTVTGGPTLVISDDKGQSTVLAGQSIRISSISGDSVDVKSPGVFSLHPSSGPKTAWWLYALLALCCFLLAGLMIRRSLLRTPRQMLLKDLRRAILDVRKGRLPVPIWRLLRSELIWGFPAETHTPSELKQKAVAHPDLGPIADCLVHLEAWRYSGQTDGWQPEPVEKSLLAAMDLLGKSSSRRTELKR